MLLQRYGDIVPAAESLLQMLYVFLLNAGQSNSHQKLLIEKVSSSRNGVTIGYGLLHIGIREGHIRLKTLPN